MLRTRGSSGLVVGLVLAVASVAVASPYSDLVLGDKPIRYYRLGEASGATAYDASATGANGTYRNLAASAYGQTGALVGDADTCVLLDGSNDYIDAPDAADLRVTGDLTLELWLNKAYEQGDWTRLVGKGYRPDRTYCLWEESGAGRRLMFQQYDNNSDVINLYSNTEVPLDQWTHAVAVVRGNTCELYVDGKLDATGTRSRAPSTDSDPLTIGYAGYHGSFPGYIDEVAVYDHAVDAGRIAMHYYAAKGFAYPDIPVHDGANAYYRFEDASSADGATAADSADSNPAIYRGNVTFAPGSHTLGGQAASLDGASYIELPAAPFGAYPTSGNTNAYTLSFETWFKTTEGGGILGQRAGGYVPAIYIDPDGKVHASMFWHSSSSRQIVSPEAYNDGGWHHLVNVYDNGVETLYLDGVTIGSQTYPEVAYSASYQYYLGTVYGPNWPNVPTSWYYFDGLLDETAIYPIALSEGDVRGHYWAGIPEPTTLTLLGLSLLGLARRRRRRR